MNRAFKYVVVGVSSILVALILAGSLVGQSQPVSEDPAAPYRHLSVYAEVFAKIKSDYVEEPDMKNVTLGAINGLLISIDPFASYLNADQYKQYTKGKELKRAAVGLVLSRKYGYEINVVDAILGSPADKAGISTGDIVESINGIQTRDMPLAFADLLLEGDPGTTVDLTVLRLRKPDPVTIKLTRAEIKSPPIVVRMADNQTGLVQVYDLSAGQAAQVAAAVKEIEKRGAKRLILDLRHDAVSADEEGIALANLFLGKGTIATLQGQTMPKQSFEADPAKVIFSGPMVILTNRGTLGAAEIAAAALVDGVLIVVCLSTRLRVCRNDRGLRTCRPGTGSRLAPCLPTSVRTVRTTPARAHWLRSRTRKRDGRRARRTPTRAHAAMPTFRHLCRATRQRACAAPQSTPRRGLPATAPPARPRRRARCARRSSRGPVMLGPPAPWAAARTGARAGRHGAPRSKRHRQA